MPEISPEFFDIFGLITFSFILYVAGMAIWGKGPVPKAFYFILFTIGILGLIVDGVIVYNYYLI